MIELLFVAMYQAAAGEPVEAVQQQPATQEQIASEEQSARRERNRRRCRVDQVTGSRLGARVCNSDAEREALSQEGRDLLQDAMRMWDNQSSGGGN
jgi:hypothetical protein